MESDCVHDQLLLEGDALVHSTLLIVNTAESVDGYTSLEVLMPSFLGCQILIKHM